MSSGLPLAAATLLFLSAREGMAAQATSELGDARPPLSSSQLESHRLPPLPGVQWAPAEARIDARLHEAPEGVAIHSQPLPHWGMLGLSVSSGMVFALGILNGFRTLSRNAESFALRVGGIGVVGIVTALAVSGEAIIPAMKFGALIGVGIFAIDRLCNAVRPRTED